MNRTKIGILDEEKEYVKHLSAYLQRYGEGQWELAAFTSEEGVVSYLEKRALDILIATDRRKLLQIGKEKELVRLWLTDKMQNPQEENEGIYSVYRYDSAEKIGESLNQIVRRSHMKLQAGKRMVAVYSPVGRCGKTSLALEVVRGNAYGKWLYFGMEDYSSFEREERLRDATDEILFYWKEHKEEKVLELLETTGNVIASGSSFLDAKQIDLEDMKWFKALLQKSDYQGAVFDIGTGILQDIRIFRQFDSLLVPYVEEQRAMIKKANLEELFSVSGMEDYKEQICFLNMNRKAEVNEMVQRIFEGDVV